MFHNVPLEGFEGGITDDMLHLAGILCSDLRVNTQTDQQIRQVVTASSDGAIAAMAACRYIEQ